MIVLDASAVVELLLDMSLAPQIEARVGEDSSLHAPAVLDLEVTQTVRRVCVSGQVPAERGSQAIADLADLPVRRYPHLPLLARIWQLRGNVSAYDAAYIALAEALAAPLVTRDRRLAATRGHRATIELV